MNNFENTDLLERIEYDELEELKNELDEIEPSEEELEYQDEDEVEEVTPQRKVGGGRLHSFDLYLDETYQVEMVPQEQIDEWAIKRDEATTKEGRDYYRNLIVERNVRLVVAIAKNYEKNPEKVVDLISAGNIGLITAAEKYDPSRGYKFSTFATWWIRQAITRERDEHRGTIRLPVHAVEKLMKLVRYRDETYKETGRVPTINEMAKVFHMTPETVSLFLTKGNLDSLDRCISDEKDDTTLQEMVADPNVNVEHEVITNIENEKLDEYMQRILSPREYFIIRKRFGFDAEGAQSLEQVGNLLGVTRERIRQIEKKALRKLRLNRGFRGFYDKNIA